MRLLEEDQPPGDDFDIYWSDTAQGVDRLLRLKPYQRMNHFPGMAVLARKNQLGKTLNAMLRRYPREYEFYPRTWLLPGDGNEFRQFLQRCNSSAKGGNGESDEDT